MTIKSVTGHLPLSQDDMTRKLKSIVLSISAIALLIGVTAMTLQPKFGLLGVAFLFGWTQLV
ncbi:MAG TPA: hypothetical protein VJM08_15260, partial [Anaerolineales bacterium]|nr:hypothetical protein [Anaerolineales bacterium]